jgi:hypothetical protein
MKIQRKILFMAGVAMALALGGCWGDDDDDPAPVAAGNGAPVPDSAGVSVSAFLGYILALGATDETSEPSAISTSFEVPPDEAAEPQPLT